MNWRETYTLDAIKEDVRREISEYTWPEFIWTKEHPTTTIEAIRDYADDMADGYVGGAPWFTPEHEHIVQMVTANPEILDHTISDKRMSTSVLSDPDQRTVANCVLIAVFEMISDYFVDRIKDEIILANRDFFGS